MSIITPTDQLQVDNAALQYVQMHGLKVALKIERERGDRLHRSLMSALVEAESGNHHRVKEILMQSISS